MLKGVLFDLGDTLQDFHRQDWETIVADMNRALYKYLSGREELHRLPPLDEFLELLNTTLQARRQVTAQTLRSYSMQDVLQEVMAAHELGQLRAADYLLPWYRGAADLVYIRPDVEPTLRLLKQSGLKLGLVSNTSWPATAHDPDLERFGIKDLLECRLYSCEVGWEKPAPQIFNEALACMGLTPGETAFVGDFLRYDVAGAHAAGMKAIWKRVEGRPTEWDDHNITPDAIITRIWELPAALSTLYGWEPAP